MVKWGYRGLPESEGPRACAERRVTQDLPVPKGNADLRGRWVRQVLWGPVVLED